MGMIGNAPYMGLVGTANLQDGAVTAPKIGAAADILTKLGYTPVNKAGDTMLGGLGMGPFVHGSNSGEARWGRGDDRSVGVATLQLGGTSGQKFEVVDRAWSNILFSVDETGLVGNWTGKTYSRKGLMLDNGNPTGNGQYAAQCLAVASGDSWVSGATYVHIKLPARYNTAYSRMFQLEIKGYALDISANRNINMMISGYVTPASNGGPMSAVSVWDATGQYSPTAYYSSTYGVGVARFYLASKYYVTFTINSIQAGNGDRIEPGELEIVYSTNSTI